MNTVKPWYQSKTIWGVLIAAGAFFAAQYLQAPVEAPANADFEQLKAHVDAVKAAKGNVASLVSQAVAVVASITAIIGRIKADSKIG
jgi:hypothetical protein